MKREILGIPFNINSNDIIPNDINTYPKKMIKILKSINFENDLYEFLAINDYNIICWHATRLSQKEIHDIKINGLDTDDKPDFFENKIANLPKQISDEIKTKLLTHIKGLEETQSEGRVYASYGLFDLENDSRTDKIFLENWGGETIYNYYDKGDITSDRDLNRIKQELRRISFPCIICLRANFKKLFEANPCFFDDLCYQLKNYAIKEIGGSFCTNKKIFEVVEILKLENNTI